ncbi:FadR/GntR family transcriptional regulator [Oceanobacillus saliphilus]|uniref:FadR/GntR family transcriptional regulator n=1 Tax=Oceanobacillus saliphilus TaxID=2925834 RepID=UPI00201D6A8C|nr:GntR family transcriptional regulator [Oceanobacillus saliphilus]
MSSKHKVYQEVIKELQRYIEMKNLNAGDKLPSERELSEKLNAGRSSVREALRALELIGLIETRHGEGTYLRTYRSFQTVELLSSFILRQENIKNDLTLTKKIIEKEAAKLAFSRLEESDFKQLNKIIKTHVNDRQARHRTYFNYIFNKTENLLLTKIWILMEEFAYTVNTELYEDAFYSKLADLYSARDYQSIEGLFISN